MGISYNPLWKLLIDKSMKKKDLRALAHISMPTMAKMGKNEYIALEVIDRICKSLGCKISDVVEYVPDTGDSSDSKKK
jgi:putative transcriptional regulator